MAAIVIPGICRYAVHQVLAGRPVVNIVDMSVEMDDPSSPNREDALHDVAGDILNNWSDHILMEQTDKIQALEVTWVDLDSLDGPVGARNSTSDETWPKVGGLGSPVPFPGMVAVRVIKNTAGGRRKRKGRMYLAGFDEGKTGVDANTLLSGFVSGMNGKMQAFLDGLSDTGINQNVNRYPVVVSNPAGASAEATRITSYSVDPLLATQRRRTRG